MFFALDIGHMTVRIVSLQAGLEVRDIPQMHFIFFKEITVLGKEPKEQGRSLKPGDIPR